MAEANDPNHDELFYGVLLLALFIAAFLPLSFVKSAQADPASLSRIAWATALSRASLALGVAILFFLATKFAPETFAQVAFRLGHLHIRWLHVDIWIAGNCAAYAVCVATAPLWRKLLRTQSHLRTGLY
jgi:hypothetical protein